MRWNFINPEGNSCARDLITFFLQMRASSWSYYYYLIHQQILVLWVNGQLGITNCSIKGC